MKSLKVWIIAGILVTLALGFALGALSSRIYFRYWHSHKNWSQEVVQEKLLARLSRKLDLNQTQIQAIGGILRSEAIKIRDARNLFRSNMQALNSEAVGKIREHLTPEQQAQYDKIVEAHRERWERLHGEEKN